RFSRDWSSDVCSSDLALALFGLGAAQGLMGWLMVMSGLVDRPSVSHYRLAAHFVLALTILGYATWLALELRIREARTSIALELRALLKIGRASSREVV